MTSPTQSPPGPRAPRVVRDLAAVVCLAAGLAGLVVCGFTVDPLLGWAAVSALTVGLGVALGLDR